MKFVRPWILSAALAVGCASGEPEAAGPQIALDGGWAIEDVDGGGVIDSTKLEIHFAADGKVNGFAGCNNFMGGYKRDGDNIDVGPLASTKKACAAEALNQQETRVLASLDAVTKVATAPDKSIVLTGAGSTQLVLRRLTASAEAEAPLTVAGEVFFLEKIALPPSAVLVVKAEDVARADAPAVELARWEGPAKNGPPFLFSLDIPPEKVGPQAQIAVRAQIVSENKLMFTSMERYSVPLEGERPPLKIRVSIVK